MQTVILRRTAGLFLFMGLAALVFLLAPMVGIKTIGPEVFIGGAGGMEADIFWHIRLPRVLGGFIAGGALSAAGLVFQTMFHNPLATPFTLGVSTGASLGAVIYIRFGLVFTLLGISGISFAAFLGAIAAILIVYGLTVARRGFNAYTMLLAGVAMSFFFSSMIMFVQYISDFTASYRIIRWLMGSLEASGYASVWQMLPFVAIGLAVILFHLNELNLISTGDDIAQSRGVDVRRVRTSLFFATSLMVGGVVSVCGPVGFIGMMAPHICRLIIGPDHRFLAPVSVLFGGAFLVVCDALARVLIAPAEIPVGVITALLGGPFFIWLLVGRSTGAGARP